MDLERKTRIDALKQAAIVLGSLASSINDPKIRNQTESLAWVVSWAVKELGGDSFLS